MSKHRRLARRFLIVVALVSVVLLGQNRYRETPPAATSNNATTALLAASEVAGFNRAIQPRALQFPRDHGSHNDFRTEWWYFTGHLSDHNRRDYGFQLTLFRFELDARQNASDSQWRTPRVLLGHFAISDFEGQNFHAFERLSRAVTPIAGIRKHPFAIWLDDWRIEFDQRDGSPLWRIEARQSDISLQLELSATSTLVAQGDAGLSRKSSVAGNASYYYSMPNLAARGTLSLDGHESAVAGHAWLDREWSTSALDRGHSGWDWFALRLHDGASLMFYHLRRTDGRLDPHSAGSYVSHDGVVTTLAADDVNVTIEDYWTSPATGIRYPQGWQLAVPSLNLSLQLTTPLSGQEWRQRFRYWEGAVLVNGVRGPTAISGRGYVELTGY